MAEENIPVNQPFTPQYADIRGRMVNRTRELQFNSRRRGIGFFADISQSGGVFWWLMQLRWPWLALLAFVAYTSQVLIFAGLYHINKSGIRGSDGFVRSYRILNFSPLTCLAAFLTFRSFVDSISFSYQTSITIGYGYLNPGTWYIDLITYLQGFGSLIGNSAIAAVVYARIFTPTRLRNSILFSDFALSNREATVFDETTCTFKRERLRTLSFRLINARHRYVCMPSLRLFVHVRVQNSPGEDFHESIQELSYELNTQYGRQRRLAHPGPFLQFPWFVEHHIDSSSPLYRIDLTENKFEIIPVFDGVDDISGLNFQRYWSYTSEDIEHEARFDDAVIQWRHGAFNVHYDRLSRTIPLDENLYRAAPSNNRVLRPPAQPV